MVNFFTVSSAIFDMQISNHAKLLYCILRKYANSKNECYPSRTKIANACGFGITTYKKAVNELISNNILTRQKRTRTNNSQTSNLFTTADIESEYIELPENIFEFGLSKMALLVFFCLMHYKGKNNKCYPSQKKIAEKCDICLTYVKLAIAELIEKNLIITENQKRENNGNTTLIYMISQINEDDKIEVIIVVNKFKAKIMVKYKSNYISFYEFMLAFIIRPPP